MSKLNTFSFFLLILATSHIPGVYTDETDAVYIDKKCFECPNPSSCNKLPIKQTDCITGMPCQTLLKGGIIDSRTCLDFGDSECVLKLFPRSGCYSPKNASQAKQVLECMKDMDSYGQGEVPSVNFDWACYCKENLCNGKTAAEIQAGGETEGSGDDQWGRVTIGKGTRESPSGENNKNSSVVILNKNIIFSVLLCYWWENIL